MSELLKIASSQYKHFLNKKSECIDGRVIEHASILKNEPFSFQALYRSKGEKTYNKKGERVSVWAETELPVQAFRVDYVPLQHTAVSDNGNGYAACDAGLFPDMLTPRPAKPEIVATGWNKKFFLEKDVDATLNATADAFRSVWFTINPRSANLKAGVYKIKVGLTELSDNEVIAECLLTLTVIDKELPKQDIYYTNWFHIDCLCDAFGVKPYSNAFYKAFDNVIKNMTEHRQNTLLLPAFTPPLDTEIGNERMNVQLVEIEKTDGCWRFGFEKMRRFVRHAKKCGVEFFEHCHLFSQWGAKNAPNIYAKDGKRIFGYDTIATSEEYTHFIRSYLKAFLVFAREEKIERNLVFHISDEPTAKQIDNYRAARNAVADLLIGSPVCDAMFDFSFQKEGLVDQTVIHIEHLDKCTETSLPLLWVYYTGGEMDTTNRKISNTAAATRVLGVYMYKYRALGFLHWAYNFYYDVSSTGFANPIAYPNAYRHLPGIAYLSYPINQKGISTTVPSIREKLMAEAMDDLRALKLLESKIGREKTLKICEDKLGSITVHTIPVGEELRELREIINAKIAE